jgi:hypothetical protein
MRSSAFQPNISANFGLHSVKRRSRVKAMPIEALARIALYSSCASRGRPA